MKKKEKIPAHIRHERHYRSKRWFVIIFSILVLLTIYFLQNLGIWLRTVSAISFVVGFYIIDYVFDIRFRHRHYAYITLIAIGSLLLSNLYYIYPNYDKVQHFVQPILISAIIFYMIRPMPIKLKWKLTFVFFITVAILGLFEISEFTLDHLFDLKLQGVYLRDIKGLEKFNLLMDPLDDTMMDLALGVLGSGAYSIAYFFMFRKKIKKEAEK